MHPAYKHLTDRLRIAELTIPQIIALFAGLMAGLVFALYLSPFSPYLTLCLSIYIAAIPAGSVLLATSSEFDLWLYTKALVGEQLADGRYAPGPGTPTAGYVIELDDTHTATQHMSDGELIDLGELWAL